MPSFKDEDLDLDNPPNFIKEITVKPQSSWTKEEAILHGDWSIDALKKMRKAVAAIIALGAKEIKKHIDSLK